jgi:CubicO group peptidase (beta-lactamase class C family)
MLYNSLFRRSRLKRSSSCLLVLILFFTSFSFSQSLPSDIDAWADRTLKTFEVPGIAIAVVKDGKVVLAKGYGVREVGKPAKVDEHTLFGIASNSKAFTTASLSMLIDEGKLKWDDPLTKYLPWFAVGDPYVTRELTIRDSVSHRSGLGLGEGDLMFFPPSTLTRDQILQHARYLKPASSMRSKYAYSNIMFLAAGQVIPAITGKSWDDFIRERIFTPLGFTDSVTNVPAVLKSANHVSPHSKIDGRVTAVDWQGMDNAGPAGAISASVTDLSKWMILQLNHGKTADGKQLFSEKRSREMWSPTTIVPITDPKPPIAATKANFLAYGLGWFLRDYHGRKLVYHTGGLTGLVSKTLLVPEENLGIVVLTNAEQGGAFDSIIYHVLDGYFGLQPTDWITAFRQTRDLHEKEAHETEAKEKALRVASSQPSLELSKYAGAYKDDWYGPINISLANNRLVMTFSNTPSMVGDLEHWQHDSFIAHWRDKTLPDAYVWFALAPDGSIENIKMKPVSELADFSFDYQDLFITPVEKPEPDHKGH